MARYIHKHVCRVGDEVQVLLDQRAEILSVGSQYDTQWLDDVVVFWTFREDGCPVAPRSFKVIGTGWEVPVGAVHRGTAQVGQLVWHLLELPT